MKLEDDNKKTHRHGRTETPMMLVNSISKIFGDKMRRAVEEVGVHSSYRHLLFHLSREKNLTQLEIVNKTHFKAPTISVTLQKMEQDGLIKRKSDENDLRQTRVNLTEKGMILDGKIREQIEILEGTTMQNISQEEVEVLQVILEKMRKNLL